MARIIDYSQLVSLDGDWLDRALRHLCLGPLCERCDERGRVTEATEDYHGEPICAGCHDSIGEAQDAFAAEG